MKLQGSSNPTVTKLNRGLRNINAGICLLGALPLALVAASPRAEAPAATVAPAATPVAAAAMVPTIPAPAPVVVPAVQRTHAAVTPALTRDLQGLSPEVFKMALDRVACARSAGISGRDDLLTVIDYTLPSTEPRLWVIDLEKGEVLFHELVAHGSGSGDKYATRFSNKNDSHQTSLGLFVTGGTYQGGNGYSLRLKGLDRGFNDMAEARHIVMHGAWYVNNEHARNHGRIGRSWGCPALSDEIASTVIDKIKGGSFVFSYAGDPSFVQASTASMNTCGGGTAPGTTTTIASAVAVAR